MLAVGADDVFAIVPAGEVAAAVSSFLAKAEALQLEHVNINCEADNNEGEQQQQSPGSAAAQGNDAGQKSRLSKAFIPLDLLKDLQVHLSRGKQADIIHQLDTQQLRQLLMLLLGHVQLGDAKLLDAHDTVSSAGASSTAVLIEPLQHCNRACCALKSCVTSSCKAIRQQWCHISIRHRLPLRSVSLSLTAEQQQLERTKLLTLLVHWMIVDAAAYWCSLPQLVLLLT